MGIRDPLPPAKYPIARIVGFWLFAYVCVSITFELQRWTWVMAGAIAVMSRLQWKYYKKHV
jgi:hypothetical protein